MKDGRAFRGAAPEEVTEMRPGEMRPDEMRPAGSARDDEVREALATLCRACGLCCDGSLFGRVPLASAAEVERAKRRHLRVVPSGRSFEQPCAALVATATNRDEGSGGGARDGAATEAGEFPARADLASGVGASDAVPTAPRACAIYDDRPDACRAFVCILHEQHRREGGPLEARLATVHRARSLLARVEAIRDDNAVEAAFAADTALPASADAGGSANEASAPRSANAGAASAVTGFELAELTELLEASFARA